MELKNMTDREFLLYVIENLGDYKRRCGGRGAAYFAKKSPDEDYKVIKRTYKEIPPDYEQIFDDYCKEMEYFASLNYNVPHFYAWTKMPILNHKTGMFNKEYFVLQERVKGRELFFSYLKDIWPYCKSFCSRDEFINAVMEPDKNTKLYKKLLQVYSDDFVNMNTRLLEFPESGLEQFLVQTYNMYVDASFSMPDIYPSNVFITKDKISLIDNHLDNRELHNNLSKSFCDNSYVTGLVWLFFFNGFVTNPNMFISETEDEEVNKVLIKNMNKVKKVCKPAMQRIIRCANRNIDSLFATDKKLFYRNFQMVSEILSKEDATEIFNDIQMTF